MILPLGANDNEAESVFSQSLGEEGIQGEKTDLMVSISDGGVSGGFNGWMLSVDLVEVLAAVGVVVGAFLISGEPHS